MDRFMLHLKNSDYTPNDANKILLNSRDLAYGMIAEYQVNLLN